MDNEVKNRVEYVDVSLLKKSNKNPRIIKNQNFAKLCDSIKNDPEFLECRPILCNKNYEIYAGNQRYAACVVLGYKKVPCIISDVTPQMQDNRMFEDNLHAGEFDYKAALQNYDEAFIKEKFGDDKVFEELQKEEKKKDEDVIPPYCESMELKNFESYDYIIFAFKDSRDFISIIQKLGIQKVDASFSPKTKKIGIGRVLDGNVLVDLLRR